MRIVNAIGRFLLLVYPRLIRSKFMQKCNLFLFDLSLRGQGILNDSNATLSGEDHLIRRVLPKLLTDDRHVFFDVGAHQGEISRRLLDAFPESEIHAFEPHPSSYKKLQTLAAGRFKVINKGLGESEQTMTLYDYETKIGSAHASIYKQAIDELRREHSIGVDVPITTVDSYCHQNSIEHIAFMKIDTEGHELKVLEGADAMLKGGRIHLIQFEFNEMNVYSRSLLRDFQERLNGFLLFRLLPHGLLSLSPYVAIRSELFAHQNILAVRKPLAGLVKL